MKARVVVKVVRAAIEVVNTLNKVSLNTLLHYFHLASLCVV